MLNVIPDGENRYRLTSDDGREVGWIRGRALRFRGFASERDVVDAARRAWRALQGELRRAFVTPRTHRNRVGPLKLVHDGAYEWISDGVMPVARLVRPPADRGPNPSFAIELLVPSYASDEVAIAAAHAIAESLKVPSDHSPEHDAAVENFTGAVS